MTEYYKNVWHGSFGGSDEELSRLLSRAADIINYEIFFSGYTVGSVPEYIAEQVKKAVCAQADYIEAQGGTESVTEDKYNSVSLGKFSYSGESTSSLLCTFSQSCLAAAGLLYRGVNVL